MELCEQTSQLTQLLYAPLGLPQQLESLGPDLDADEYNQNYRQWEDALHGHLYQWKQIPADRVAASMHYYVEVKRDPVVVAAIRREASSFNELVEMPRIVELIDDEKLNVDLNTPEITAFLVNQVLEALCVISGCMNRAAASGKYWSQKYGVDTEVRDTLGCIVFKRRFSPNDIAPLLKAAGAGSDQITPEGANPGKGDGQPQQHTITPLLLKNLIQALDKALCLPQPNTHIKVTIHQYLALLSLHGDSDDVQRVLLKHLPAPSHDSPSQAPLIPPPGLSLLESYRIGLFSASVGTGPWAALGLGVSPIMSLLVQLESCPEKSHLRRGKVLSAKADIRSSSLAAIKEAMVRQRRARSLFERKSQSNGLYDEDEDDDEDDDKDGDTSPLKLICQAIDSSGMGDEDEEVWETDDGEDEDDEEEEEEEEKAEQEEEEDDAEVNLVKPVLPTALLVSLLVDRAEYVLNCHEFDIYEEKSPAQKANEDIDRTLAADPYCPKAYGMRAQLAESESSTGGEDDSQGLEDSSCPGGNPRRMMAAKAALAAFLLGGSTDLALAATAEEALRKESRSKAKTIFLTRSSSSSSTTATTTLPAGQDLWVLPRGWQVQAYLSGFDLPNVGLEMSALQGEGGSEEVSAGTRVILEAVAHLEQALLKEGRGDGLDAEDTAIPGKLATAEGSEGMEDSEEEVAIEVHAVGEAPDGWAPPKNCVLVEFGRFVPTPPQSPKEGPSEEGKTKTTPSISSAQPVSQESQEIRAFLDLFMRPDVSALAGVRFVNGGVELEGAEEWPNDGDEWDWDWDWEALEELGNSPEGAQAGVRARLLSLAGSLAYLLGFTKASVLCFRKSLRTVPLADTLVKLAALLNDMDEPAGAHVLFGRASSMYQARGGGGGRGQVFCLLHMAELAANLSDFEEAVGLLGQAKRINDELERLDFNAKQPDGHEKEKEEEEEEKEEKEEKEEEEEKEERKEGGQKTDQEYAALKRQHYSQVRFTVLTLLGVTLFRLSPNSPDSCLEVLRPACSEARAQRAKGRGTVGEVYLLLCMGEVLAQCGDLTGSLDHFRQSSKLYPSHPLPFINAARTYQQLNLRDSAAKHIAYAVALDPYFPLPHVDLAQALLYQGKVEACSEAINKALKLARHGESGIASFPHATIPSPTQSPCHQK